LGTGGGAVEQVLAATAGASGTAGSA
jgi:hypothetical protein